MQGFSAEMARVADLEQTLSIVQTAQEWTLGKGRTCESVAVDF